MSQHAQRNAKIRIKINKDVWLYKTVNKLKFTIKILMSPKTLNILYISVNFLRANLFIYTCPVYQKWRSIILSLICYIYSKSLLNRQGLAKSDIYPLEIHDHEYKPVGCYIMIQIYVHTENIMLHYNVSSSSQNSMLNALNHYGTMKFSKHRMHFANYRRLECLFIHQSISAPLLIYSKYLFRSANFHFRRL